MVSKKSKKILIIDDDHNHLVLLRKRLESAGYSVIEANNGIEGVQLAVQQLPNLIITDILLPRLNGFQVVEQLKSNHETSAIPIIMMSAVYVTEEDMARGFELGAETYVAKADLALRKPMQEEVLLDAAASLLKEKETEEEGERAANILIVDDDPDVLRLTSRRLEASGYDIGLAASGEEALEKIYSDSIDLVLLDIRLPEMDGLTVLSKIKERYPDIAVIMMTAYGSEQVAIDALRRGADDYLIKPLERAEPLPTVEINLDKVKRRKEVDEVAGRLRQISSPELEEKERLIEELRQSSITLMDQYNRLLAAEEQNRAYAERLEQMVEERTYDLERRTQELETLYSVLSAGTRSQDVKEVVEVALSEVANLLEISETAVFLLDPETGRFRLAALSQFPAEFLRWVSSVTVEESIFAEVIESSKGVLIDTIDSELASLLGTEQEPANLVVCPLKSPQKVIGVIIGSLTPGRFIDAGDWKLLDSIGEEAGVVVENLRLDEHLRQAYISTIRALAEALDARDSYTRGHSDNVSSLAVMIAGHMDLDQSEMDELRDAGYLHDVGKIGTPDSILLKEGILTKEEMKTMMKHPGTSYKILDETDLSPSVKKIIRHHHERYDGTGYPDRLKGEQIPAGSRILSVADAYEAMTSDRPYREKMSEADAIVELKRCAGDQFDPEVVKAFIEAITENSEKKKNIRIKKLI